MATVLIQDVYTITGVGTIPVGQVTEGILKAGMKANINGKTIEVRSIEMKHQQIQEAKPGDNIGFSVKITGGATQQPKGILGGLFGSPSGGEAELLKQYKGKHIEFY